jgi:hypothetical protein
VKMIIESSADLTTVDGVPVRLWHGTTEAGIPCLVFVRRIAVALDRDRSAFDAELEAQEMPLEVQSLAAILAREWEDRK